MHIHHQSNVALLRYQPSKEELIFNYLGYPMKKYYWYPSEFYLAADCKLIEWDIRFKSESLKLVGEKLKDIKFLDRSLILQCAGNYSFVDIYMFNMKINESEMYMFDGLLIEFNLDEMQINELIEAINNGVWHKIKFAVAFNESLLLNSLLHLETHNLSNFCLNK